MLPRLFPTPWFYAVIRLDPLTMVKDLGLEDSETLAAVKEFRPKKYLVYVDFPLDLPMPNSKWCRYCVKLIGTTLRPMDGRRRLLPDMVVPIFPNTQCSGTDRRPVLPETAFPFANCFHWIESLTIIRMRRPAAGFVDDSRAIRLSLDEHHELKWTLDQDYDRMDDLTDDSGTEEDDTQSIATPPEAQPPPAVPAWAFSDTAIQKACCPFDASQFPSLPSSQQTSPQHSQASTPAVDSSMSSQGVEGSFSLSFLRHADGDAEYLKDLADDTAGVSTSEVADIFALNIFGWDPDPTFPLVPLVDLWFELDEHLTAETIPSPLEWFEEEEKIASIITDAFARRKLADSTPITEPSGNEGDDASVVYPAVDSSDSQGEEESVRALVKDDCNLTKPSCGRVAMGAVGAIGAGVRWVLKRTARALRFCSPDVS